MEQPQQRSKSMVFVLVVSAILLAVATFLTILLITSRNSATGGGSNNLGRQTYTIVVNGVPITLDVDPNKVVFLEGETISPDPNNPNQGGQPENQTPPTSIPPPTSTPPPTAPPPTPTRPEPIIFKDYTVVQGDTLYGIADSQNSSVALMARYGFDANDLVVGNVLRGLPVANPAYCPGTRAYVVRDKETVYSIAQQFNTTVEAIAQENQLGPDYHIDMTQVICIPT